MRTVITQDGRRAFFHGFAMSCDGSNACASAILELLDGNVIEIEAHGIRFEQTIQQDAEE